MLKMRMWKAGSLFGAALVCASASAQVATVNVLGIVTATGMVNSLGFNAQSVNGVEFSASAALGSTHSRLDSCGWSNYQSANTTNNGSTEIQSAPGSSLPLANTSGGYQLPANCSTGINNAKTYGQKPTLVLTYGPPYHQTMQVQVDTAGAASGSLTVPIVITSSYGGATTANITPISDYLYAGPSTALSANKSYGGSLITAVSITDSTHATLTLSSALSAAQAAGVALSINEFLYQSPFASTTSDAGTIAYTNMAHAVGALAVAITPSEGELWNEPPWPGDKSDNRTNFYDTDPMTSGEMPHGYPDFAFAAIIQNDSSWASNFTAVWGGTEKAAASGMIGSRMLSASGQAYIRAQRQITSESIHPYGNNPEDSMWNHTCLAANTSSPSDCPNGSYNVLPLGSGFYQVDQQTLNDRASGGPTYGIHHVITETGFTLANGGTETQKAVFVMRQWFGFMTANIDYIEWYRFYDATGSTSGYSFATLNQQGTISTISRTSNVVTAVTTAPIQNFAGKSIVVSGVADSTYNGTFTIATAVIGGSSTTLTWAQTAANSTSSGGTTVSTCGGYCSGATGFTPLPVYTAMLGVMTDLKTIANTPPVAYTLASLASVTTWSGTYQLAVTHNVGATVGATQNSDLMALWQVSATTSTSCPAPGTASTCWTALASPAPANATVTVPSGMSVKWVKNSVTQSMVSYTTSGSTFTVPVADVPLEAMVSPIAASSGGLNLGGRLNMKGVKIK